jgi:hypothetical protein
LVVEQLGNCKIALTALTYFLSFVILTAVKRSTRFRVPFTPAFGREWAERASRPEGPFVSCIVKTQQLAIWREAGRDSEAKRIKA